MTMQIDHAPYAPAFDLSFETDAPNVSPIAIVALNAVVTASVVVLLSHLGLGLGIALFMGWIGGGMLTLVGLLGLVAADDRRVANAQALAHAPRPRQRRPEDRRAALLAEWEADRQADMQNATATARSGVMFGRLQTVLRARRTGAANARPWSHCG